ncbi:hypothetical protein BDR26DRAFT_868381 [Obelidium mucronatum]|nr:hypothetical protein BDR26DRAFT_868381 [Obelidium mucronatum]
MFQIAWRTHLAVRDLLASLNNAIERGGYRGLLMVEYFLKGLLKGLNKLEKRCTATSTNQKMILVAIFTDCSAFLARSITCLPLLATPSTHQKPTVIKLMSHPLLLLKHIVNPILRLAIWQPTIHQFASQCLTELATRVQNVCKDLSKPRADKKVSWKEPTSSKGSTHAQRSGTVPWLISEALSSAVHVAGFLEIMAKWLTTSVSDESEDGDSLPGKISCLDRRTSFEIIQWTLSTRIYSARLVQLFLLPFLEQVAGLGGIENTKECVEIVIGVYNGRIGKDKGSIPERPLMDTSQPQNTIHYLTKWLITTACSRTEKDGKAVNVSSDNSQPQPPTNAKFVSYESMLNLRKFAIHLLGILTNGNREISLCLLSLFDDFDPEIRKAAAHALAIRSLNNDPAHFHIPNSTIISSNAVHHRESGECIFDDPRDAYGIAHWFRQNEADGGGLVSVSRREDRWVGLPTALKTPFKYLIWCLDDSVGFEEVDSKWQGSDLERASFGEWAFYISKHIYSECPILANPNIYSMSTKGLHLPTLSDPRQKSVVKVANELMSRLMSEAPISVSKPENAKQGKPVYSKDQLFSLHHCIAFIATGILEGSKSTETIPHCDHRVLRAFGNVLHRLRHDETPLLRVIVLESLARVLGAGALIDRVNEANLVTANDMVQDLFPNFSQKKETGATALSKDSIESLEIIYRLVRGLHPFDGDEEQRIIWGSEKYDLVDQHLKVSALREALLNYGELVHLHSVFRLGRDFETQRFARSHGLMVRGEGGKFGDDVFFKASEIPQGNIRFNWAHREEKEKVWEERGEERVDPPVSSTREIRPSRRGRLSEPDVASDSGPPESIPVSSAADTVKHPFSFEEQSSILQKIAEEEAIVLEEFRKRIQRDPTVEKMASIEEYDQGHDSQSAAEPPRGESATVLSNQDTHHQPEAKGVNFKIRPTAQSVNDLHRPPNRFEQHRRHSLSHRYPQANSGGEGASAIFRKTAHYFDDAFDAVTKATIPTPSKPQQLDYTPSKACLDEELESIISEHESSLRRCEKVESEVIMQAAAAFSHSPRRASMQYRIPSNEQPQLHQQGPRTEGASEFMPIEVGDISTVSNAITSPTAHHRRSSVPNIRSRTSVGQRAYSEVHITQPGWSGRPKSSSPEARQTSSTAVDDFPLSSLQRIESAILARKKQMVASQPSIFIERQVPVGSPQKPPDVHIREQNEMLEVGVEQKGTLVGRASSTDLNARVSVRPQTVDLLPRTDRDEAALRIASPTTAKLSPGQSSSSSLASSPKKVEFGRTSIHHYRPERPPLVQSMQALSAEYKKSSETSTSLPSSPKTKVSKVFVDSGTSATAPSELSRHDVGVGTSQIFGVRPQSPLGIVTFDTRATSPKTRTSSARSSISAPPSSSSFFSSSTSPKAKVSRVFVDTGMSATAPNELSRHEVGVGTSRVFGRPQSPLGVASDERASPTRASSAGIGSPMAAERLPGSVSGSMSLRRLDSLAPTPPSASAAALGPGAGSSAIQNTWLLRRMDYAKSPSQTPFPVKSPSVRNKLPKAASTSIAEELEGRSKGGHSNAGLRDVRPNQEPAAAFGLSDGGEMDLQELTRENFEVGGDPEVSSNAVNLEAFLAGNGLCMVENEVANDGQGGADYRAAENFFQETLEEELPREFQEGGSPQQRQDLPGPQKTGPSTHDFILNAATSSLFRQSSRRVSDPFIGGYQYGEVQNMVPPRTPASGPPVQQDTAAYTGMSVFHTDGYDGSNEPSEIPLTPGSPISFSWSRDDNGLVDQIQTAMESDPGEEEFELDEEDERQLSMELARKNEQDLRRNQTAAQATTLSFFKNIPSFSNLAANTSSSMVRPRLRAALELVLRHLVFSFPPKGGGALDQSDFIDYYDLYSHGLVYGSLTNLAAFPVAGAMGATTNSNVSNVTEEEQPVSEALHPLLKSVFQLDMSLMVDLCGPKSMGKLASQSLSASEKNGSKRLRKWLAGLTEVHRFLLSTSRAIFHVESQLGSELSLAQAMVVVKDQISIARMTGSNNNLYNVDGTHFGGGSNESASFMEWVSACCHNSLQ